MAFPAPWFLWWTPFLLKVFNLSVLPYFQLNASLSRYSEIHSYHYFYQHVFKGCCRDKYFCESTPQHFLFFFFKENLLSTFTVKLQLLSCRNPNSWKDHDRQKQFGKNTASFAATVSWLVRACQVPVKYFKEKLTITSLLFFLWRFRSSANPTHSQKYFLSWNISRVLYLPN